MNKINKQSLPENIRTVGTSTKSIPVGPTSSVTKVHNGVFLCLSVDSEKHTWEGKQLVLVDGSYSISTEVTKGLMYTSSSEVVPPKPGGIYSADGLLQIAEVSPSANTDAVVDYIDPYAWEPVNRLVPNNDKYDFIRFNDMPYCKLHEDNSWSTTVLAIPVEDSSRTIMFSAAVYPNNSEDYKYSLLTYGADQSKFRVYLHNGVLKVGVSDTVSDSDIAATNPIADVTKIHTYAVSYDGSQITMYCDGELILSSSINLSTQHGSLVLGCSGDSNTDCKALLGRVIIYNKALSQDIIKEKLSLFILYSIQIPLNGSFEGTLNGIPTEFNPSDATSDFVSGITQPYALQLSNNGNSYKLNGLTIDKLYDSWLSMGVDSVVAPGVQNYAVDDIWYSDFSSRTILRATRDFIFSFAIENARYRVKIGDGTRWFEGIFKYDNGYRYESDDDLIGPEVLNGTPQSIAIAILNEAVVQFRVDGQIIGRWSFYDYIHSELGTDIELQLGDSDHTGSSASVRVENITLDPTGDGLKQYYRLDDLSWSDKSYCINSRGFKLASTQDSGILKFAHGSALVGLFKYNGYQRAMMLVAKNPLSCMMQTPAGVTSSYSFKHGDRHTYYYSVYRNDVPIQLDQGNIPALPLVSADAVTMAKSLLDYSIPRGEADVEVIGIADSLGGGTYQYSKQVGSLLSDYTVRTEHFEGDPRNVYRVVKYEIDMDAYLMLPDGYSTPTAGLIAEHTGRYYQGSENMIYLSTVNQSDRLQLWYSEEQANRGCSLPDGCRRPAVSRAVLPVWWGAFGYLDQETASKIAVLPGGSYHDRFLTVRTGIEYRGNLFVDTGSGVDRILTEIYLSSRRQSSLDGSAILGSITDQRCNLYTTGDMYLVGGFDVKRPGYVWGNNPWLTGYYIPSERSIFTAEILGKRFDFFQIYGVNLSSYSSTDAIYITRSGDHCVAYNKANQRWDLFLGPYDIGSQNIIVLASLYDVPADQVPDHGQWVKPDGTPL